MPRPKQRTGALRARVVDVAVDIVANDGVAALTTRRVAAAAGTSPPAVYELFGDKAGLVRAVFFEGFRALHRRFERLPETDDPRADVMRVVDTLRSFARDDPALAEVMFSHPLAGFDPIPDETAAAAAVREFIIGRVRRCVDAGVLVGNPRDIAHVLLALAQGLWAQESAGWLGTSPASRTRRWRLATTALLDGLSPGA